jgi:hypothetical protein
VTIAKTTISPPKRASASDGRSIAAPVDRRGGGTGRRIAAGQRRTALSLESAGIGHNRPRREQGDLPAAEHDRLRAGQRLPGVVGGLAQVRGTGLDVQVGPQRLDHLVAQEAMPVGKRQKLHQLGGATARPHIRPNLIAADGDPEPAEQLDADAAVLRFTGHRLSVLGRTVHEERFENTGPARSHERESKEEP